MSAVISVPPPKFQPASKHLRMPYFKYTGDPYTFLYSCDVGMYAELHVVGQPGNGCYEWLLVEHGRVTQHSDCGYGDATIALRDGLIAYHGLPEVKA